MLSVNVFDLTYTFIYKKYGGRAVSRRLFFVLDRGGDQGFETTCFHFFFVMNVPRANSSEERRVDKRTGDPIPREKKGGHERQEPRHLFRKWNGYEKGKNWFVLKTIKWLTPIYWNHMEQKLINML